MLRRIIEGWALLGGLLLLAVVLLNAWSVTASALFARPFAGDFELTEIGVCVAVFAFLPYCQLTRSNVSADIFTSGLPPRAQAVAQGVAAVVAAAFASLLLWRMWAGMLDQKAYDYTTTILQVPHWMAFVPVLVSLGLLVLAAVADARRAFDDFRD